MFPEIIITNKITTDQSNQIDNLWNKEYPKNLNNRFSKLLNGINTYEHHLLVNYTNEIIAWAVVFLRDKELWFSIIVNSEHKKKGYGKMLLNSLKQEHNKLNGWVIDHNNDLKANGDPYRSPLQLYLKNGFKVIPEERIEADIISAVKICNFA